MRVESQVKILGGDGWTIGWRYWVEKLLGGDTGRRWEKLLGGDGWRCWVEMGGDNHWADSGEKNLLNKDNYLKLKVLSNGWDEEEHSRVVDIGWRGGHLFKHFRAMTKNSRGGTGVGGNFRTWMKKLQKYLHHSTCLLYGVYRSNPPETSKINYIHRQNVCGVLLLKSRHLLKLINHSQLFVYVTWSKWSYRSIMLG